MYNLYVKVARVAELVDALDSGSSGQGPVGVRVSSRAPSSREMVMSPIREGCTKCLLSAALFIFLGILRYGLEIL